MNEDQQLKLQAFLDGELPEQEGREVAAWVARDREATELLTELRNTRKVLKDFEPALKLPETREFYWSKIERQIQHLQPEPQPVESASFFTVLRRLLVPTGTVAVLLLAVVIAGLEFRRSPVVPDSETASTDSGTFTYQDYKNGTTLVWVSYPAEREFAENTAR